MAKSIFGLSKLLAEVAMRQVLVEHPHQPQVYGQECPFCQSTNFVKYSFEKGKQRYRCRSASVGSMNVQCLSVIVQQLVKYRNAKTVRNLRRLCRQPSSG
jgi:hypothetical protein